MVAHALQVEVGVHDELNQAQVGGHGLLQGDGLVGPVLQLLAALVNELRGLLCRLRLLAVALHQGVNGIVELDVHVPQYRDDLLAHLDELTVVLFAHG